MLHYEIIFYWSTEDNAFVAEVPELPGCMAHGATQEGALANVKEAMQLWIDGKRVRPSRAGTQGATAHVRVRRDA